METLFPFLAQVGSKTFLLDTLMAVAFNTILLFLYAVTVFAAYNLVS